MNEQLLFDFLRTNNIEYKLFKHQPVFKVGEEPVLIDSDVDVIPGTHSKNLFLKDTKSNAFFLVSVTQDKRVDLGALHKLLGCARFSFGKPEELLEHLKLTPGAVTPFGLMFDEQRKVTYVLDEDFLTATWVNFHPLRNDMNVCLTPQDFIASMEKLGHVPKVIQIPVQKAAS